MIGPGTKHFGNFDEVENHYVEIALKGCKTDVRVHRFIRSIFSTFRKEASTKEGGLSLHDCINLGKSKEGAVLIKSLVKLR